MDTTREASIDPIVKTSGSAGCDKIVARPVTNVAGRKAIQKAKSVGVKKLAKESVKKIGTVAATPVINRGVFGRNVSHVGRYTGYPNNDCSKYVWKDNNKVEKRKRNSHSLKKRKFVDDILERDVPQTVICIYSTDKSSTMKKRKSLAYLIDEES